MPGRSSCMKELPSPNSTGSFSPSLCEPCGDHHAAVLAADVVERDPARDGAGRGERPVRVVLVPGELAADDRLLDRRRRPPSGRPPPSPSSCRAMPAMTGLASIFQKRSSRSQRLKRNGTECGCFSTSSPRRPRSPSPSRRSPCVSPWLESTIGSVSSYCWDWRRPSRWSSSASRELLDLRVVEHADREQEAVLVVAGDLLGGQRIGADFTHCTFSSWSGSGT